MAKIKPISDTENSVTKFRKTIYFSMLEVFSLMLVGYTPVSKVPMTLTAKRATLSDFGNAYWIHK